jgi:hypothetical protein
MKKSSGSLVMLAAAALLLPVTAAAIEVGERVQLHGYGQVSRAVTNQVGEEGEKLSANNYDFSLLGTARLADRVNLWAQIAYLRETRKVRLDWAFLDFQATPTVTLRAGQVRLPFGIYNEVRDVEFTRASSTKPFLYDEELELATEAFRGASVEFRHDLLGGSIDWDLYAGRETVTDDGDVDRGRIYGSRLVVHTPVAGLSFMGSGYHGVLKERSGETDRRRAWAVSADYAVAPFDFKAELGSGRVFGAIVDTWYVQAAYTFWERLTPYSRYEYLTTDRPRAGDPSFEQKTWVVGVGFNFTQNVGARLEHLQHRGYALPVFAGDVEAGEGRQNWQATVVSVNFIF